MYKNIFKFGSLFFFLMLVSFSQNTYAQLSGSYTIPGTPFATVKAAFDSLNLVGVSGGGVTFDVSADYTESVSDSVLILTATGTTTNPIIFQKSGVGANPLITRTDAGTKTTSTFGGQGDAVIIIQGSDHVTFDGINVATTDQGIEYGYYLRKVSGTDGCKYVTIKNSVIDLTKGTSAYVVGIYSSNNTSGSSLGSATGIAITDISGRNEFVTLTGNTIQDVHAGIILRGFNHTVAPNDFQDFNFVVGTSGQGNIIQNYAGGSATTSYGVYLINHTNPTVSYNTINNTAGGGVNSTAQIYGIFMSQSATNPGGDVVMSNNNITIGEANTAAVTSIAISPACISMTVNDNTFGIGTFASTTASFLINISGLATTKTVNGNQNIGTITKTGAGAFTCLASSGSPVNGTETFTGNKFSGFTTTTTSAFTGITVGSSGTSTRNFYNNKVSNITLGTGAFTGMSLGTILTEEVYNDTVMTATGTGSATGINCSSTQAGLLETVRDNYVTGFNFTGGSGTFTGIATGGVSSTSTRYVYNNTVTNCAGGTGFQSFGINSGNILNQEIYNNLVSGIIAGGNLNGLTFASQGAGLSTVYNNTVYDLTTNGDTRSVIGISNASAGTTYFYKNSVSKLRHTFTGVGASSTVRGIDVTIGYKNYVYNNIVSDLDAPNITSTGNNVYGINSTNSANTNTIYLHNNTVYVNSTGTTYKSYGIFSNSSHNTELRNNLVVNNSAGLAFAYGRSTNALGTYSMLSDNNNFYSSYKTYIGGTTDTISTISQFRTTFYPREQSSFSESSPFVNVSTSPFDVHLNTAIASQTESGGAPVTTPIAITNDYDGDVRNANYPDVGADEFSGITTDLTGPVISYAPLGYTGSTADRTLVVSISDRSGVPSTPPGMPILYWKKNYNGTWTADTVSTVVGNDFTFNFGGGVTLNDTVFYYVAAQDGAGTPNVRIVPIPGSGGYTSNPPAASIPPTNPDWYKISSVSLAGDYTVGVAEFNQITGRKITFTRSGDKLIPMENGKEYTGDLFVKKAEHPEYNYPDNVQGIYTTLTSAVNDLNLRGVTAPVNFLLTDALYDGTTNTFPLVIKVINENLPTAVNQVTFKPNTSVTSKITHSLATNTLFKILSNYINIDGSNSGGADRSLTIENSSTTSPRVIWFGSVGTNPISWCTVENCNIIVPGVAIDGYGVSIADSATAPNPGYSNNMTVQNNYITGPYGVYVYAPVVNNLLIPGNGSGLSINGNTIDSSFNGGMYLNGLDNISVTNNTVTNVRGTTGGGGYFIYSNFVINSSISNNIIGPNSWVGGTVFGIRAGNNFVTNSNLTISGNTISGLTIPSAGTVNGIVVDQQTGGLVISNNKISNLKQTNTTSRSAIGINLNGGIPNGSITVANNFIWDLASYGDVSTTGNNAYGILIQSFTTGANGYKIYHNTVALTTDQTLTTSNPACLFIGSGISTPGAVDIRDNIFANFMTVGANRYAVINGLATNVNLGNIDYNDYYTTGPNLGRQGSTNYADIIAWRTATGQDVNSISADPMLVSATDLHIDPSSLVVSNNGTYLAGVPTDIDGDTRNNPPDIGADEYTFTPPPPAQSYAYDGGVGSYGAVDLSTGLFTTINMGIQGQYFPISADNDTVDAQYVAMSNYSGTSFFLAHMNFTTQTQDSIGPIGPLATGQTQIKALAYNVVNSKWFLISSDDFASSGALYTVNINTGALTLVGTIQNAAAPITLAIDCNGNAYVVNVEGTFSTQAVLYSINLTTAVATQIGTNLGFPDVTYGGQDMDFNPDNGNLYWGAYWSSGFFSEGPSFRLVDVTNGTSTEIVALGEFDNYVSFSVNAICSPAATFQLSVSVTNGWNMVSVPGTNPDGMLVGDWWSNLTGTVYQFVPGSGYAGVTTAASGEGYWMKNNGDQTYNYPAIQIVTHNTITASAGWNMFGGYEDVVDVNALTTNTGNIVYPIYQFNPGAGYAAATSLIPGVGYWVKVSANCEITIPDLVAKGNGKVVEYFKSDWGRIVITDANGSSYTLYGVKGEVDLSQYELPPLPPAGIFDVRYGSGRVAEDINSSMQTIAMSGITYPITIKVEGMDIRLMDETGKTVNVNLKSGENVTINDATIQKLKVYGGESMPTVYALEQNYPNPFNPSTVIEFSLPEDVSYVKLTIYNALGERVDELVNTSLLAGKYSYQWNAKNVATGMYIYELRTDKFVSVKKMLLLK